MTLLIVSKLVTIVVSLYFIALFLEFSKDVDEEPRLSVRINANNFERKDILNTRAAITYH